MGSAPARAIGREVPDRGRETGVASARPPTGSLADRGEDFCGGERLLFASGCLCQVPVFLKANCWLLDTSRDHGTRFNIQEYVQRGEVAVCPSWHLL